MVTSDALVEPEQASRNTVTVWINQSPRDLAPGNRSVADLKHLLDVAATATLTVASIGQEKARKLVDVSSVVVVGGERFESGARG